MRAPNAAASRAGGPWESSFSRPLRQLPTDPKEAQCRGLIARRAALERYILPRFLHNWGLEEAAEVAVRVS